MKTTIHDNDAIRINRLGVVMALMHRKNIFMSVSDNEIICDIVEDMKKGHIKERRAYQFDDNDLLVGTIEWEARDIEQENEYIDLMRGEQEG